MGDLMAIAQREIEQLVRQSVLNELGAMLLYTRLADRVGPGEAGSLLRILAAAEENHIGRLTELVAMLGADAASALDKVGFVSALRHEANRQLEDQLHELGLSEASTVGELLTFAVSTETRAGDHYERLATHASDPRIRDFFSTLVLEEAGHAQQLESLRRMLEVSSPER